MDMEKPSIAMLSSLKFTRDVFREALRLYPPVPMMVREATRDERFRNRPVPRGAQIVISPWHLHRHDRHWQAPDAFDPDRWQRAEGQASSRAAYLPFSSGPRVCPGAGFAMVEGPILLALLLRAFRLAPAPGPAPMPVAHLTVRAQNGIRLMIAPRTV
jgi:cytochrome P450